MRLIQIGLEDTGRTHRQEVFVSERVDLDDLVTNEGSQVAERIVLMLDIDLVSEVGQTLLTNLLQLIRETLECFFELGVVRRYVIDRIRNSAPYLI